MGRRRIVNLVLALWLGAAAWRGVVFTISGVLIIRVTSVVVGISSFDAGMDAGGGLGTTAAGDAGAIIIGSGAATTVAGAQLGLIAGSTEAAVRRAENLVAEVWDDSSG